MGHKDRDLALVLTDGLGDLQRCKDKTTRGVEHEIDRHIVVRHLDGAQNLFGIVDVDITCDRKTEEPHGLLPVHQQDNPRFSLTLDLRNLAGSHRLKHLLLQHRLDRREYEENPEKITDRHGTLQSQDASYLP